MERNKIIEKIIYNNIMYHFGIGWHMIPDDFEKWLKLILSKLDNKHLAQETRKCGLEIKAKDIV
jgi:hypothetical protein